MENRKRIGVALAIYAALGLLIWTTMSGAPIRLWGGQISFWAFTLAIVAFFAVKTVLHWKAGQIRQKKSSPESIQGWRE